MNPTTDTPTNHSNWLKQELPKGYQGTRRWDDEKHDTPRTDSVFSEPCALHQVNQKWEKIIEHSRQLERELAEAKADVERLKKELADWDYGTRAKREQERAEKAEAEVAKLNHQLLKAENDLLQSQDINSFLDTEFRIACQRAEKAEAEVERLTGILKSLRKSPSIKWHRSHKVLLK